MKALITGAGGFIGSFLLKELINKQYEAKALFMPDENADVASELGAEIIRGDLTQPETLKNIAKGVDVVFHLATRVVDWGSPKLFRSIMVDGTQHLLEESKNNASRFIYFSSIAALGLNRDTVGLDEDAKREKTGIPYCDTKIDAENLVADFCRNNNMSYTIIRPANVIGPGSAWVRDVLDTFFRGPFPLVGGGKAPGAFVYVKNLIDGTILAAESEKAAGKTYHFRDDYDITWKEYIETLGSWLGQKPFGSIPFKPAYVLGSFFVFVLTPLGIRPPLTRLAAGITGKNNDVDVSRAKEDLKWQTRIPLNQAMDEIKEWVMANYTPPGVGRFKDFHNRTVFITGGSSGIGLEIARLVVARGAHTALFARDIDKLQKAYEDILSSRRNPFQKIIIIPVDITDADAVNLKTEEALIQIGKPDILINSAGINRADYFENLSYKDFDDVFKTNVYGTRNMTAALLPAIKEKGGHIVNISSAAGLMGMFGYTA
ncbi:MAG: SDR family NAD(P)-dependent oxidoreductase, partial [Deltaproteobacteria bacterium]|nr:SDR family NAD(P)-dependent oxidoreductase [Deltaproteobacteria bacterium]